MFKNRTLTSMIPRTLILPLSLDVFLGIRLKLKSSFHRFPRCGTLLMGQVGRSRLRSEKGGCLQGWFVSLVARPPPFPTKMLQIPGLDDDKAF